VSARFQEIILFNTNDIPHQSAHTPKICHKNKSNIPSTRWSFYIIDHYVQDKQSTSMHKLFY